MLKLFVFDKLLFQINPFLLRKFVDWINVTKLKADNLIHMKQKILDIYIKYKQYFSSLELLV